MYSLVVGAVIVGGCEPTSSVKPEPAPTPETLLALPIAPACSIFAFSGVVQCTEECHCYFSSDCGPDAPCVIGGCQPVWDGKLDGICRGFRDPGAKWVFLGGNTGTLARSADFWFQTYIAAAQHPGRMPDKALLIRALEVPLSEAWHREVKDAVNNAIDIAIGFDFKFPRGDCFADDPRCLGQFHADLSPSGVKLLEAFREGFTQALQNNDPSAVEGPLRIFWKSQRFSPLHTGRCYPHDHPDFKYGSAMDCQIDSLKRILGVLLAETP